MTSPLFTDENRSRIKTVLAQSLNQSTNYLSEHTATSTRATGDAIQSIVGKILHAILADSVRDYKDSFTRRAMADLAFTDNDGNYHAVDVKTHCSNAAFSMPNLISVERLCRFYEKDTNFFDVLLVEYTITDTDVTVVSCEFVPIEWLSWGCLTVGALGWGQIQIANARKITINRQLRREWMLTFCERMKLFYPKEMAKIINKRVGYFDKAHDYWLARSETNAPQISPPDLPIVEGEVD